MLLSDALMALRVVQHAQANSRSRSASINEILAAAVTASAIFIMRRQDHNVANISSVKRA
jgi:hypothetical protein